MTATTMTPSEAKPRKSIRWGRIALYVFLTAMSVLWLLPLVWAVYTSLRTFGIRRSTATSACRPP